MATTTTWSITYPTSANQITPLETHFANLASSTDTALTNARNQSGRYTGTNAQRLALVAGTGRSEGTEFYTTDTDKNWMYDGTQWISADTGLYIITPAAAPTGFTIGSDGSLVATNLSSGFRNFDNIFSGRFRNYRVEINTNKTSTATTSVGAFRSGSSTISSANHYTTAISWIANSGTGSATGATGPLGSTNLGNIFDSQGSLNYTVAEIANPFIAEPTLMTSRTIVRGGLNGDVFGTASLETSDSITGLSINFGQTLNSCRIRFYGYA